MFTPTASFPRAVFRLPIVLPRATLFLAVLLSVSTPCGKQNEHRDNLTLLILRGVSGNPSGVCPKILLTRLCLFPPMCRPVVSESIEGCRV